MGNQYIVVIPSNIRRLNLGFSTYSTTRSVICEATSINEILSKYPDAISIQAIKGKA